VQGKAHSGHGLPQEVAPGPRGRASVPPCSSYARMVRRCSSSCTRCAALRIARTSMASAPCNRPYSARAASSASSVLCQRAESTWRAA
jgi:hypothetical protein